MTTKAQKIRLGVFAVATAGLVALVLIVFAGLRVWEGHDRYYVVFADSVLGLEKGAEVTFGGIKIGTVASIKLDPDDAGKIRVALDLDEGLPIKADTTATLSMAGITGLKVIDLRGGSAAAPRVAAGATISTGETTLSKLERQAKQIVDQSEAIMGQANQVIGQANQVMANLAEITEPSQYATIGEFFAHATTTSANLELTSAELHAMVAENRAALRTSLTAVAAGATAIEGTATRASALLDEQVPTLVLDAHGLIADLRGVVRSNGTQLGSAMFDLRQASRSFKELARDLRQQPSRLLRSSAPAGRRLP